MQSFLHPCPHCSNTIFRYLLPHFVCGEVCSEHCGIVGGVYHFPRSSGSTHNLQNFLAIGIAVSISSSSNVMRSMCTSLGVHRTKSQNNRLSLSQRFAFGIENNTHDHGATEVFHQDVHQGRSFWLHQLLPEVIFH